MKIKTWNPSMTPEEAKDLAYEERNMLALWMATLFKGGWYNDDLEQSGYGSPVTGEPYPPQPRYKGERRVISIFDGKATFHVPDDFDLGPLPQIERDWDGHSTEEKWTRILKECGVA